MVGLYAHQLDHGRYLAVFMLVLLVDEFPWVYPLPPEYLSTRSLAFDR